MAKNEHTDVISKLERAAITAHEVWAAFTRFSQGRDTDKWVDLCDASRDSTRHDVRLIINGVVSSPKELHIHWMGVLRGNGFSYGPRLDPEKRKHPCMRAYEELSSEDRCKNVLLFETIKAVVEGVGNHG
jgi:hypothetical protein